MTWLTTEDGSLSWHDTQLDELCHNRAGAYTEAMTQYAQPLLAQPCTDPLNVLDACFGLGYNTWAIWQLALTLGKNVITTAIELDPKMWPRAITMLQQPCFDTLNRILNVSEHKIYYQTQQDASLVEVKVQAGQWFTALQQVLDNNWTIGSQIIWLITGPQCELKLHGHVADLLRLTLPLGLNAICHDAFSWRKVPHLWTAALFTRYRQALLPTGIVLTYSRATLVKQTLADAGFLLELTPRLGRKKGGLLARNFTV